MFSWISRGSDDPFKGDGHMLKHNVEPIVVYENVQGDDDVRVQKLSKPMEHFLRLGIGESSHMDEVNWSLLSNGYFNCAGEFKIIDFLILLPGRFPRRSELNSACHSRFVGL